ncbi:hypothetical protein Tco_0748052 [Tanacetum coccineum]|uniref:Uncharacterized protein n=1 Tax=Tanacetum coccineum TaxID=301880 RepID=A0ABQ4YX09_9ASTR
MSGNERSDKGYDTNSLLEQWRDSNPDNDDYDSFDALCVRCGVKLAKQRIFIFYNGLDMYTTIKDFVVDNLEWRDYSGTAMDFSVSSVWDCIRPRGDEITWCDVIYAGTPKVAASLNAIVDYIIPISKKKTARSVIAKLVFAASTYFIWQERNYRLFKNQKRSPNQIIDCIKTMVSSLSMAVYGSRLEYQLRAVLFFPSPGFFPLGLAVPVFTLGDDPIACLNKAVAFMSVCSLAAIKFLLNQQFNLGYFYKSEKNQTTIQDGERHMARQCTKPTRPRNSTWFQEKLLLVQAQESCHVLDEEQTKDLDAYDSDCDDVSTAHAILMANLSNYGSYVISEVPHYEPYHNDMDNQSVHAMQDFEQTSVVDFPDNEITSDSNAEKLALKQQIDSLEQILSNQIKKKESLLKTFTLFKNESKEKESKYMDKEIDLEKKIKELDNIIYKVGQSAQAVHMLTKPQVFYDDTHKQALGYQNPFYLKKAQRIKLTLYDGSVISSQHVVIPVNDEEETLILEEVSRSKMLAKQNDPISKEKKINTTPINYVELNQLSEDFDKRFVPQQELIEAPSELPKVSLVNTSLKKLRIYLSKFDIMVKKQITPNAIITKDEWGFEHTKAIFLNEIIPFLKTLKDIFDVFDKDLLNEVTEVQTVFNQMEAAIQQCSLDKQCFEIHKKELFLDNDQLLHQIMSQDILLTVMNSTIVYGDSINLEMQSSESCDKCFDLDAELLKKQNAYNELLKTQLQAKDTTIRSIKSMRENDKEEKVKHDMDEIETINIELEHRMFKLDLDPLAHRLLKNRNAHIDYLKYTHDQADILRRIVKQAKAKQPLDNVRKQNPSEPLLDSACMFTKHV